MKQDKTVQIFSWEDLYRHHEFLAKPLMKKWKQSSVEKEKFFSLTFYALLRSQSSFECGVEPEKNTVAFEKRIQVKSIGLTKIEREIQPYFKCLLAEWKKVAKPLIFKSCKYYFTH